jgi:hypothetical protein
MHLALTYKKFRTHIISAAFIDEGSCGKYKVRDNVCAFCSVNPRLVEQVMLLMKNEGYSLFTNTDKNGAISVYLHSKSLQKFYKDIAIYLPVNYYKRINTELLLKRRERDLKIEVQLKQIKRKLMKDKVIHVIEVQRLLAITEQSARRRLSKLGKRNEIEKVGRGRYEIKDNPHFIGDGR